ncbi:uncharacterized protein LOC124156001 isoform X2 [Ischnura elegans]|nr:uncharacterized protein LOC124156001 isoform X2 [Ischnura elegans]XP_046386236.1 uncharacterized protein LOC124156001 isoform X2 [Ischnura elegans]
MFSKGSNYKNRGSDRFVMDNEDGDSYDFKGGPKKGQINRKSNNFTERPQRNREAESYNSSDRGNSYEVAGALSTSNDMGPKNVRTPNGRNTGGREHRASERDYEENTRRSIDGSPPRLVKKSPRSKVDSGTLEIVDGPPKLVKGSEYYGNRLNVEESTTRSLALRAAHDEVWRNHPLQSEMKLKEVILTNFDKIPSRKDIYDLCLPVKPLHVSFGVTLSKSIYCRVLVSSDAEVKKLHMLSGEEVYVTTLEELLDELFINDDGD